MAEKFIDLGQEYDVSDCCCKPAGQKGKKKVSYPTLYITGVKGLGLTTGDIEFRAKGKVVSVRQTNREEDKGDQFSVEIEVHSINAPGAVAEDTSGDSSGDKLHKAISSAASNRKSKMDAKQSGEMEDMEDEE